LSTAQVTV